MKIFKIIPIFFLFIAPVYGQNDIKDEVFDLAMNNMDEFVEFLSYPNDSSFSKDIYNLIEWTKNCLLYTSPSPRDRQKSRMPSSA